jgi:tetratricopeptide (TPR) repeat protein
VLAALVAASAPASASEARDRPPTLADGLGPAVISPAERAAVELALEYLADGAEAWQRRLAAGADWGALSAADAAAEIAVRVGSPAGARWQLQHAGAGMGQGRVAFAIEHPSGADETLWLELVEEGGEWRLLGLRSLAERVGGEHPEGADGADYERIAGRPSGGSDRHAAPIGAFVALLAAGAALLAWQGARGPAAALVCAALALSCGVVRESRPESAPTGLRTLAPLREAMTADTDLGRLRDVLAATDKEGEAGQVVRLWMADLMLRELRLNDAEKLLATYPTPAEHPLAELLRARLAALRGEAESALIHYERVRSSGGDHDGLRLEAALALANLGMDEAAERAFSRLTAVGSRMALPYYAAAEVEKAADRDEEAEALFRTGWRLQPLTREELFRSPLLANICTHESLFALFDFGSADEPALAELREDRTPLSLPPGATASVSGSLLRIELGEAELLVPGGSEIAPREVGADSPAGFARRQREKALAELETLQERAASAAVFSQPALRRRIEDAAFGLLEGERWEDLLALTAQLAAVQGRLPPALTQLRAAALVRSGQRREAFDLLVRLAKSDKNQGRRDAGILYQLADVLVREQQYDLALRVLRRANAISGLDAGQARERQVKMEQRLAEAHEELATPYFRIRYPRLTGEEYPRQLATVLEEERKRLSRWIPVKDPQPIPVDLYPVQEFLDAYSRSVVVVGLFDGRVRVPFADLRSLHPELVGILSHELAHALITQATADRAPRWLQEGLAQHVEMVQDTVNPFPDLAPGKRELSLSVVEEALAGFSEPQFVELSYAEAAWAVHYLEAAHGLGAIHRLLAAYRAGANHEQALQQAVRMALPELDVSLRRWAVSGAPKVWPAKLRRYDLEAERLAVLARGDVEAAPVRASSGRFTAAEERKQQMVVWHAAYARGARPVKAAYGQVLSAYGQTGGDPRPLCAALTAELARFVGQGDPFQPPDVRVRRTLIAAYQEIDELADACAKGQHQVARAKIEKVGGYLREAADVLGEYGLQP